MKSVDEFIKVVINNHSKFSSEFWKELNQECQLRPDEFYYSTYEKTDFEVSDFENEFDKIQLLLALIHGLYPFWEKYKAELCIQLAKLQNQLLLIDEEELSSKRDHLLYLIYDFLFSNPEVVENCSKEVSNLWLDGINQMSQLKYDHNKNSSDSYLMNNKAIKVVGYFKTSKLREEVIKSYLSHFDPVLREDIKEELTHYA
jgi:hypothetical protein